MDYLIYKDYVYECGLNNKTEIISNGNLGHAAILIAAFFLYAKDIIKIFSSKLIENIYEDEELLKNAENFLQKGRKVEILLQETNDQNKDTIKNHKFIKLCEKFSKQCTVKTTSEKDEGIKSHFVIMDKKGFRFCSDKTEPTAIASFNQTEIVENLISQFNKLYKRAYQLSIS